MKANTLIMLKAIAVCISGLALSNTVDELGNYFNEYDKVEDIEYSDEVNGTAAQKDLLYHLILSIYGFFTMAAMSIGGVIFTLVFFSYDDEFSCDLQESVYTVENHYHPIVNIRGSMTSRADCKANVLDIFHIVDLNGDGYVERCEDAAFQHAFGATPEYAY